MNHSLLVIDIGTQSLRASVVDDNGSILAFSQQKYDIPYFSKEKGYAEQYADYYMEMLCKATNDIYQKQPEVLKNISAMVLDCFRDSSVILDENKKPIRPAILWLDQRITRIPKMKNHTRIERFLLRLIGMTDTARFNAERTVSYWIRKHEPENWNKMKHYVPLSCYFNYKITGNLVISSADCVGHYPVNFKKGVWYGKRHLKQNVFQIPNETLPEIVKTGSIIGEVTEEFSQLSHIPTHIQLIASATDKSCETFGNGCIDNNIASISLGTACTICTVGNKYREVERFLPCYPTPYRGSFDYEIQIYRGLWMIRWFLENFGAEDLKESQRLHMSVEEYLNHKIQEIPVGSDGLVLQPYWGPGLKRPNAKGSIVGFSGVHTRYHFYRAIIEGIGFGLRDGLDTIVRKTHKKPTKIIVSGGGSQSDIFVHIVADIMGIDCYKSYTPETSTLGAAMSSFIVLGVFKNEKEAVDHMVKYGECVHPNPKNHIIYEKLYHSVYKHMYPSLKGIYNSCKNFFLDQEDEK